MPHFANRRRMSFEKDGQGVAVAGRPAGTLYPHPLPLPHTSGLKIFQPNRLWAAQVRGEVWIGVWDPESTRVPGKVFDRWRLAFLILSQMVLFLVFAPQFKCKPRVKRASRELGSAEAAHRVGRGR